MDDLEGKVKCTVCGEEVDLSNKEEAVAHMTKDDAHKKHRDKANYVAILKQFTGIIKIF